MTAYAPVYDQFAVALLNALDIPATGDDVDAIVAWIGGEAGWSGTNPAVIANNPLNIKAGTFRGYGIPVDGVQSIHNVSDGTQGYGTFTTLARGAAATAAYLRRAGAAHGYLPAIAALRRNDASGFLDAIARSDWAASHYGLPGTNHLLANLAYVRAASHHPPLPVVPEVEPMTNLFPLTCHRVVDLPAGTVLAKTPGGDPYTTLRVPITLGLLGATSTHFHVADGDAGVYVERGTLTPRTADKNVGA